MHWKVKLFFSDGVRDIFKVKIYYAPPGQSLGSTHKLLRYRVGFYHFIHLIKNDEMIKAT
jgi:hypothetical protein